MNLKVGDCGPDLELDYNELFWSIYLSRIAKQLLAMVSWLRHFCMSWPRQNSPNHTDYNIFKDPSASLPQKATSSSKPSWEVMYINVLQVRFENDDLILHLFLWCHIIICLFLLIVALSCSSSQKTIDTNHGKSSPSGVVAFGQYPLVLTCKDHEPRITDTDLFWYARKIGTSIV